MVATFSASTGMATSTGPSSPPAPPYNAAASCTGAYWHVGWGGEVAGSWADPPNSPYFDGEMTDVAIYSGTALSQTQGNSNNSAGTQAAEQTAINAINPTYDWALLTAQTVSFCSSETVSVSIENDVPTPGLLHRSLRVGLALGRRHERGAQHARE